MPKAPHRRPRRVRLLPLAVVVCEVLAAEQRSLGPPEVAPFADEARAVSGAHDLAEEVVRREEEQAAPEVTVALHEVVQPAGDIFGVSREDDQVVGGAKRGCGVEELDVLVGIRVDGVAARGEPVEELHVIAAEALRDPRRWCGRARSMRRCDQSEYHVSPKPSPLRS